MTYFLRTHGGPDALGVPLHDFSTNSNACGPCPQALAAVQAADATRYPDAGYASLRASLAEFYGVQPWRITLAGSASEFIYRFTAWAWQRGARSERLPTHAYDDYAHAAHAWGLAVADHYADADLVWACEPSSPLGQSHAEWPAWLSTDAPPADGKALVLDCAYAPLRLEGVPSLSDAQRQQVWQLFSPNKALGLTGVRAAFAIAPLGADQAATQLDALAPSWVIGAHGVAMLQAWARADTQTWLHGSLQVLRNWKQRQVQGLHALGWTVQPSDTAFFCAQPPVGLDASALCAALRLRGLKLRDATSFGLAGWVRLGVLSPVAQDALLAALGSVELVNHASITT
ncbi:MAG: aminotransferase [Burkholderiales bacterium PBB4]|nr:MAG: aminotransferase [Burkholderiales bacterium PBB4]